MNNIHTKGTYLFRINVVTTVNNETLHKNVESPQLTTRHYIKM